MRPWTPLIGLAIAPLLAACGGETEPKLAPPYRTADQSAGAELCRDCHEGIVESYGRTGMARALGPIEPGELDGLGVLLLEMLF